MGEIRESNIGVITTTPDGIRIVKNGDSKTIAWATFLTLIPTGSTTTVVDAVNSSSATAALSANQGRLQHLRIADIETFMQSNDVNLDEFQEVVAYIKANREDLDALSVANIIGLQDALDALSDSIQPIGSGELIIDFTQGQTIEFKLPFDLKTSNVWFDSATSPSYSIAFGGAVHTIGDSEVFNQLIQIIVGSPCTMRIRFTGVGAGNDAAGGSIYLKAEAPSTAGGSSIFTYSTGGTVTLGLDNLWRFPDYVHGLSNNNISRVLSNTIAVYDSPTDKFLIKSSFPITANVILNAIPVPFNCRIKSIHIWFDTFSGLPSGTKVGFGIIVRPPNNGSGQRETYDLPAKEITSRFNAFVMDGLSIPLFKGEYWSYAFAHNANLSGNGLGNMNFTFEIEKI